MNQGSQIIKALEGAWIDIRRHHDELPDVVFITGGGRKAKSVLWGRHWPERWTIANAELNGDEPGSVDRPRDEPQTMTEIFIGGECLAKGPEFVLETMLHEAAHGLGTARGVRHTSGTGNKYHNRKFAGLAREMLLDPPASPEGPRGFSEAVLTDEARERYARTIERLTERLAAFMETSAEPPKPKSRNNLKCGCPNGCEGAVARLSPKVLDLEAFGCLSCNVPLVEID